MYTYIHTYICYGTHTVQNPTTSRERALHSESLQSDVKSGEDGLQGPVTILGPSLMAWQIVDAETPHPLRCDTNYQTDVKLLDNNAVGPMGVACNRNRIKDQSPSPPVFEFKH